MEKVYVPSLIFGQLLTSSNYDDTEKKVTGGRNGFGAKLCNIFSKKFTVETACKEYGKKFKQVCACLQLLHVWFLIFQCSEDNLCEILF